MYVSHVRSKKIADYINALNERKELKKRQRKETQEEVFKWELEGAIREIEVVVMELEKMIKK